MKTLKEQLDDLDRLYEKRIRQSVMIGGFSMIGIIGCIIIALILFRCQ